MQFSNFFQTLKVSVYCCTALLFCLLMTTKVLAQGNVDPCEGLYPVLDCSLAPAQNGNAGFGPLPCNAYWFNANNNQQCLFINCQPNADTDGEGVDASIMAVNMQPNGDPITTRDCWMPPAGETWYIQWIKAAQCELFNGMIFDWTNGAVQGYEIYYTTDVNACELDDLSYIGCSNEQGMGDFGCSDAGFNFPGGFNCFVNSDPAVQGQDVYYFFAVYYTLSTGTINFKNKQCLSGCILSCAASNSGPVCQGGAITLSSTVYGCTGDLANVSYSWTGPGGFQSTAANPSVNPAIAGLYTLEVSEGGQMSTCTTMVTLYDNPTCTATPTDADCYGASTGSISASGSGGTPPYTYSNGGAYQASGTFSGLAAGNYTITVKDANDCTSTCDATVGQPTAVSCAVSVDPSDPCTGRTVALRVSGSGGTPPYTYRKGGGTYQASGLFPGLVSGNYTFTVKDANGCTSTCTYNVGQSCETAWAWNDNSTCFDDLGCPNASQLQWGFTTQITAGTTSFDLLAGAPGRCAANGSLGEVVGTVEVTYAAGGVPSITITKGDFDFNVVHVWASCNDPLPLVKRGRWAGDCIAAPGQFMCSFDGGDDPTLDIDISSCFNLSGCSSIWLAIHVEACEVNCANPALLMAETETGSLEDALADEVAMYELETGNINPINIPAITPAANKLEVYPNPILAILRFRLEAKTDAIYDVAVFDLNGNKVQQSKRGMVKGINDNKLDLSNLPSGMYLLRVSNGEHVLISKFAKLSE